MPDTITITDDRTGKTVTVPIEGGVFPASAVRELDPSLFVYDPASRKVSRRAVEVAFIDGTDVALASGVNAETQVVTDGAAYVVDGKQVRLVEG